MLGKIEITRQGNGQSCWWEYYCGNCGKRIGTTTGGSWPGPNSRRTENKKCISCKTDNVFNIIGKKL